MSAEERGSLWLYASVATALGIPFNLLLMAPPTASWELAGGCSFSLSLVPYVGRVAFSQEDL